MACPRVGSASEYAEELIKIRSSLLNDENESPVTPRQSLESKWQLAECGPRK